MFESIVKGVKEILKFFGEDSGRKIGAFLVTQGLAVFLVLYFVTTLYPTMQAERKEWLEEVARIEVLLDPSRQPVSKEQTYFIYSLAVNSFFSHFRDRINSQIQLQAQNNAYRATPYYSGEIPSITLLNQHWRILPSEKIEGKAEVIISEFIQTLENIKEEKMQSIREVYGKANTEANSILAGLDYFFHNQTSLKVTWGKTWAKTEPEFRKEILESAVGGVKGRDTEKNLGILKNWLRKEAKYRMKGISPGEKPVGETFTTVEEVLERYKSNFMSHLKAEINSR